MAVASGEFADSGSPVLGESFGGLAGAGLEPVEAFGDAAGEQAAYGQRDVLVTAAMAALSTPSTYRTALPDERLAPIMTSAAHAACTGTLEPSGTSTPPGPPAVSDPPDRAAQILDTAFALFHRRGYAAVSLDDIGAAIGIAGPSIYHHYDNKAELLVAAFDRVLGRLPAIDENAAVADALHGYIDLARHQREAIGTCATERISLPITAAPRIERALADDLASWTTLVRRERPDLDAAEATLLVEAARSAVHDVVRLGRLHARPNLRDELLAIGTAILSAPVGDHRHERHRRAAP